MNSFNDALRLSYIFLFVMIALRLDGGGRLEDLPTWAIILVGTLPVVTYWLTSAVMFTIALIALFFVRRR